MGIFQILSLIIQGATAILPAVAQARKISDPSVSNAGLINSAKTIQLVAPVVQHVEAVAAANPGAPMTGAQKLQLAQDVMTDVHSAAVASGALPADSQFEMLWNVAVPAITAVCAAKKAAVTDAVQEAAIGG